MNGIGKADGRETSVRGARKGREVEEGFAPRKVAPWFLRPEAWTPWSWREKENQFQTFRKHKYQV
jgi:hypothetical protein